jgi:hypothetical protein
LPKMKIVRDAGGAVINIGPWDYQYRDEPGALLDRTGKPMVKKLVGNPLPQGAYEDTADIVVDEDGSRRVVE